MCYFCTIKFKRMQMDEEFNFWFLGYKNYGVDRIVIFAIIKGEDGV